ncbi:MAG TPA: hypothetical protein PKM08_09950, partial [Syntrophorhabdaceae bacterium]|nr:hypothetical protein [Syntrophorhabdaceae bacterium]
MRSKSVLSLTVLIASWLLIFPFCVAQTHADVFEQDRIAETIAQKKARWSPRDNPLSRLSAYQRAKRFGSA